MIAVVDYHKGNLKSVERGLANAGGRVVVTDDAALLSRADAIVVPGVGSFGDAASTMRELGQMDVVRERVADGVPFLGICLGLHLMYEYGEEESVSGHLEEEASCEHDGEAGCRFDEARLVAGMGILPGTVYRMPRYDAQGLPYKIPHVGWNTVCIEDDIARSCPLLSGVPDEEYFYFTHSFIAPAGDNTIAQTTHSVTFPSVVHYGDVAFGVQFHPEKSSDTGIAVLRNFVEIVTEG